MSKNGRDYNVDDIKIVGDGRGTMQGDYLLNVDRPIDRVRWILECFPEWGQWLNREIEETVVPEGNYAFWWTGGMGFVLKSPGGAVLLVDNYAGPAHYTEYEYCGVCRTSGSPTIDWLRLNPQVIDIFGFKTLDGVFCSHQHADHTDIYTLKAATQTSDCKFYGPLSAVERMRKFQVPEERIQLVRPGQSYQIKDVTIDILPNYDRIATMTGGPGVEVKPGVRRATTSRCLGSSSGLPRACTWSTASLPFRSGLSMTMWRSNRPGRNRAGSRTSGLLVAAMTMMPSFTLNPSISTRSWFNVCSRSSWPPP